MSNSSNLQLQMMGGALLVAVAEVANARLLEDGFFRLLEDGSFRLLEIA